MSDTTDYGIRYYSYDGTVYQEILRSQMPRIVTNYSYTSLSAQQQAFLKVLQHSPQKILGQVVKFVCGVNGVPFVALGHNGGRGNIIKWIGDPNRPDSLIFTMHMPGDALYQSRLYEFELATPIKPPNKKEMEKLEKERKLRILDELLATFNRKIDKNFASWEQSLKTGERGLAEIDRMLKDLDLQRKQFSKQIKDATVKIAKGKASQFTLDDVMKSLQELYKNKNIERVYISTDSALTIQTKMLHANKTDQQIGRFVLRIDLIKNPNREPIMAYNLDYSRSHPNIDRGHICWGANGAEVTRMYEQNQLYQLVDFMLIFFTTFPHEDGSPYIDYNEWLSHKSRRDTSNTALLGPVMIEVPLLSKKVKDVQKIFLAKVDGRNIQVTEISEDITNENQQAESFLLNRIRALIDQGYDLRAAREIAERQMREVL